MGTEEYSAEHGAGQFTGAGILLAGVVGSNQQGVEWVLHRVAEPEGSATADCTLVFKNGEVDVKGDLAQSDHHPDVGEQRQFPLQVAAAAADLPGRRFVRRRRAAHRGGDVGAAQFQAVLAAVADRLGGETAGMERAKQVVSGAVAGEHASGAVGAMGPRRQPDHEQTRRGVAERGHGPPPILTVPVRAPA